jgi:inosine-uridine nucleoside N-ribohydrolase
MNSIFLRGALASLAVFFCAVGAAAQSTPSKPIPVILSTDIGNEIDDQWTVVYLLINPDFKVLGVISAHAPVIPPPAGRTGLHLLFDVVENRMGMKKHPPLLEGASEPLPDLKTPKPSPGADFIIEASKSFSSQNRLAVLAIGAVTDVASAILKDPTIVDRIYVVDMGLRAWPGGGDDFNILNDVKAMQVIMESDVPLVVGSAPVCAESLGLTLDQTRQMLADRGPIGKWLLAEFEAWYFRFVKPMRKEDFSRAKVIWDNVVLAHVLGMTTSRTYPRPKLTDTATFEHGPTKKTITWITDIDEKRMWDDFLSKLDLYQQTHAVRDPPLFRHTFLIP